MKGVVFIAVAVMCALLLRLMFTFEHRVEGGLVLVYTQEFSSIPFDPASEFIAHHALENDGDGEVRCRQRTSPALRLGRPANGAEQVECRFSFINSTEAEILAIDLSVFFRSEAGWQTAPDSAGSYSIYRERFSTDWTSFAAWNAAALILASLLMLATRQRSPLAPEVTHARASIAYNWASVFIALCALALSIFGVIASQAEVAVSISNARVFSVAFLATAVIFAPLCEEILYREWMQEGMLRHFSVVIAIPLTAGVFALAHSSEPERMPFVFLAGLSLGLLKMRTASLSVCIAIHMLFNALVYTEELSRALTP